MTMNFLSMNMAAPKLTIVPEGEYQVTVVRVTDHVSKDSGKPSLKLQLKIDGHPNSIDVINYLSVPAPDDDEATQIKKINRVRDFLDAFQVPYTAEGFDQAAIQGSRGWVMLGVRAGNNGDENEVRRISARR